MQTEPAIITAAICGAETTREQTPYLPITAEEPYRLRVGRIEVQASPERVVIEALAGGDAVARCDEGAG